MARSFFFFAHMSTGEWLFVAAVEALLATHGRCVAGRSRGQVIHQQISSASRMLTFVDANVDVDSLMAGSRAIRWAANTYCRQRGC